MVRKWQFLLRVVQNICKRAYVMNEWSQLAFLGILLPLVRGEIGGQIFGPELISSSLAMGMPKEV